MDNFSRDIPQAASQPISKPPKSGGGGKAWLGILIMTILLLAAIAGAAYYQTSQLDKAKKSLEQKSGEVEGRVTKLESLDKYVQEQIDEDKYQAVFLVGGQVYFGKITHIDSNTATIENIYYLKNGSFSKSQAVTGGTDVSLVKLGNELHKPEDKMVIERKNITFWENLKTDGDVAKAIVAYEKANPKQ